ncbi:MAG: hypothetical protein IPI20_08140 [Rhodoferax sp.]|nr:hypothetical protein [Rhodoferax sp.]
MGTSLVFLDRMLPESAFFCWRSDELEAAPTQDVQLPGAELCWKHLAGFDSWIHQVK